jgi:hypothetical protein
MRKLKIKVYAVDKHDKKKAKIMEELLKYYLDDWQPYIDSLLLFKKYLLKVYGVSVPMREFDRLMELAYQCHMRVLEKEKIKEAHGTGL